jgi:proteasome lid subunit RPN8/RPN11
MQKYKETYISIEEFSNFQRTGRFYEGFVVGLGYAYVAPSYINPPNFNGYSHVGHIPQRLNRYTLLHHQVADNSPEMKSLSMNGIAQNSTKLSSVQTQQPEVQSQQPTKEAGGVIDNYSDFFNFMHDKSLYETVEVAAFALDIELADGTTMKRYWVMRWDENTRTSAHHYENEKPELGVKTTIVAEYHTHPAGTERWGSYLDAQFSKSWKIPVYPISKGRVMFKVDYSRMVIFLIPRSNMYGIQIR